MSAIGRYAQQVEIERDRAVEALRVLNEETILAGFPGGDRSQTLANVRAMAGLLAEAEGALNRLIGMTVTMQNLHHDSITKLLVESQPFMSAQSVLARIQASKGVGL